MASKQDLEHLHIKEITVLTLALILAFCAASYKLGNVEFFYYSIAMLPFLAFFYFTHDKLHISVHIFLLGLVFGFLHLAGGITGLYEKTFFGIGYDNLTHIYGAFIMALIAYNFLRAHWTEKPAPGRFFIFLTVILIVLGVGALVEIIEFAGVLALNAPGVGSYFNNAMDLVRDGTGAAIGAGLMVYLHH